MSDPPEFVTLTREQAELIEELLCSYVHGDPKADTDCNEALHSLFPLAWPRRYQLRDGEGGFV